MPLSEKFPIGCRVSGRVDMLDPGHDVPMRVVGYDGLNVIVEVLQDGRGVKKGKVMVWAAKGLTLREEVKFIPGEPEDGTGAAIGWMELGGLSVAITRSGDSILLSLEVAPDSPEGTTVKVHVARMHSGENLWEGVIT